MVKYVWNLAKPIMFFVFKKKKEKQRFETIDEFLPGPATLTRRNRCVAIGVTIPGPSLLNNWGTARAQHHLFATQTAP